MQFISEQYSTAVLESIASGYSDMWEWRYRKVIILSYYCIDFITAFIWCDFYN